MRGAVARVPNALTICVGMSVLVGGLAVDVVSPLNMLERNFGARIGEIGFICMYLSMALLVVRITARRERALRAANANVTAVHEAERARMARDVHDGIGQWLSGIKIKLDLLTGTAEVSDRTLRARLTGLSEDVEDAIDDVRRIALNLAPSLLEERGLIGAMQAHADQIRRDGAVTVTFQAPEALSLDPSAATHLFRIFQEALANARRHSRCRRIDIRIEASGHVLSLEVRDDGDGFDAAVAQPDVALGLRSIRSRAALLNGCAQVLSAPGAGTTIRVEMPLGDVQARTR